MLCAADAPLDAENRQRAEERYQWGEVVEHLHLFGAIFRQHGPRNASSDNGTHHQQGVPQSNHNAPFAFGGGFGDECKCGGAIGGHSHAEDHKEHKGHG
jgi:hypothetical protein